jgi:hypothetical protein
MSKRQGSLAPSTAHTAQTEKAVVSPAVDNENDSHFLSNGKIESYLANILNVRLSSRKEGKK